MNYRKRRQLSIYNQLPLLCACLNSFIKILCYSNPLLRDHKVTSKMVSQKREAVLLWVISFRYHFRLPTKIRHPSFVRPFYEVNVCDLSNEVLLYFVFHETVIYIIKPLAMGSVFIILQKHFEPKLHYSTIWGLAGLEC